MINVYVYSPEVKTEWLQMKEYEFDPHGSRKQLEYDMNYRLYRAWISRKYLRLSAVMFGRGEFNGRIATFELWLTAKQGKLEAARAINAKIVELLNNLGVE